jgi:protein SCO1/2
MKKLLVALNLLLMLAIFGVAFYWQPVPDESSPLPTNLAAPPQGGDFTLDGPKGAVSLHDFAGKLVLLQFGYTYCPDICPTALAIFAQALGSLTPIEISQVQPLFVSVDPERDTAARLVEYTTFFHPSILGLTGPANRLTEITGHYGAVFVRQENASAGGYVIDHTALTYLIDKQGRLIASLPHALPPEQLVAEIRKYLPTN